jgi:SAM-dependent methyltransferase
LAIASPALMSVIVAGIWLRALSFMRGTPEAIVVCRTHVTGSEGQVTSRFRLPRHAGNQHGQWLLPGANDVCMMGTMPAPGTPADADYLTRTREFFASRAATWDTKFGNDLPAYTAAIAEAGLRSGGVVIDVGCGTGRALPPLRAAVGPDGSVIALDLTPEMLAAARPASQAASATLVLADARSLPFADASADAIFAAGLVHHLPDPEAGLRELARVTRPGGLLVLFHPSGRAALAARHGRVLSPDEPLEEGPLRRLTAAAGWALTVYDDAPSRFFAVATRTPVTA